MNTSKVDDWRLVSMVQTLGNAGYNRESVAAMLRMSVDTLRRITWLNEGLVFGKKSLPKPWFKRIRWVSYEHPNVQGLATRVDQWVQNAPQTALETIRTVHPLLDPVTGLRWLEAAKAKHSALCKIASRAANICKKLGPTLS